MKYLAQKILLLGVLAFVPTLAPPGASAEAIEELTAVSQLAEHFNEDQGEPRLVLLLSPT